MPVNQHVSPHELFPPSRVDALARLKDFVPLAGREYATKRNADSGPGRKDGVSMLSPYIRHRLLTEREVVEAVLQRWAPPTAEKFIQEVFWRTYWKGWLQLRPEVWQAFVDERDNDRACVESNSGSLKALDEAESGQTGIDCFDDWVRELIATGYLHNHVRMWFASIWIFTLKLPWALGADFFLRHLLDADPASNTLGWRWVAGIQTPGKAYLARPDNIEKYTGGRYRLTGLSSSADAIRDERPPKAGKIGKLPALPNDGKSLLLLHGDDLHGLEAFPDVLDPVAVVIASSGHSAFQWPFGDKAQSFVQHAANDAAVRIKSERQLETQVIDSLDAQQVIEQIWRNGADHVIAPEAPVGPLNDGLARLSEELAAEDLKLYRFRRDWDAAAWPHASRGFFAFKKHIPEVLEHSGLT